MIPAGQDFVIPFTSPQGNAHVFNRANGNSLEPRIPRMLGRLSMLNVGRGLVNRFAVSGWNLLLGNGFPLEALTQGALTDRANLIGVAAGPNTPVELEYATVANTVSAGYIGTDPVPAELEGEILAAAEAGELWGLRNFAWGLGEQTQPNPNTAEVVSFQARIPRAMVLERMVVLCYRSDGAPVTIGSFQISRFHIRGMDMLSRTGNLDCLLLGPGNSDEDGMMVAQPINTDDLVEIDVNVAALGAGVSGIIQIGFFTS
jgi:hypothetical protein